jgi:hypothetical protein
MIIQVTERDDDIRQAVRLLVLLSRTGFTPGEKRQIEEELLSFSEWKLFAGLAVRHGVAALVWQNISDLALEGKVPETERILFDGLRLRSIARVAWITETAAEVTRLLESEGIRVVLLKGLALEHTLYGSRGLRQMSDADLLVAPSDALRARDILTGAGFESMPMKSPLYRHIILDIGNHLPELHRGGVSVDLHYRLFGPEGEEMVARAIEESETITSGSSGFRVLPPMIAFLALVSHIYKHEIKGEFQLRLWVDVYLLLARHGSVILTDELTVAAMRAGVASETRIVLTVMEQVWAVRIPAVMRARSEDAAAVNEADRPAGMTGENTAVGAPPPGSETDRAGRFMHDLMYPGSVKAISQREMFRRNLKALHGTRKKAIFLLGDIFPSPGFMKRRYGCRSDLAAVMFYPHRLGKLAWILGIGRSRDSDS